MNCDQCFGAGTTSTGRVPACGQCSGRGYGSSTSTPCMGCAGSGQGTGEIRESCWRCHGSGSIPDPEPIRRERAPKAANRPAASAPAPSENSKAKSASRKGGAPSGAINLLSLLAAGIYGYSVWTVSEEGGTVALSVAIAFALVSLSLHIVYYVLKAAFHSLKYVVPFAAVLAVGNYLDWEWAEGVTRILGGFWGHAVQAAERSFGGVPGPGPR